MTVDEGRGERVFEQVCGGVRGGEGDGDDEIGGGEPQQSEDEEFALPPTEQAFEHGDRALAVGTFTGDTTVDREGAKQGEEDEHEGRERGEHAGREGGDAGLIAEG